METILVVEDEIHVRQNIIELLTYEGYKCLEASDGLSALTILKNELPELPFEIKERLVRDYGIKKSDASLLLDNLGLEVVKKFEEFAKLGIDSKRIASAFINKKETLDMSEEEFKKYIGLGKESIGEEDLNDVVRKVLESNPKAVEDLKNGKENSIQFLVGCVMRETKGRAEAEAVINKIKQMVKE